MLRLQSKISLIVITQIGELGQELMYHGLFSILAYTAFMTGSLKACSDQK